MSTSTIRRLGRLSGAGIILVLLAITALAQSDNTQISGFVKDQSGAVVANAKVTIKSETKSLERTTTTNSEGYYVLTQLPPDFYTLSVEANGFKLYQETNRKLDPNIPARVDVSLQPGQVTETISVTATISGVQSESSTVGKLVEINQVEKLQLNGRNPLFLASLKAGVNSGGSLSRFSFGLDSGGYNINGSRSQDNLITYDGAVGIRTRSNGTSIGVADLDSTQEIQILTANYNAEYGRSSGGQIRIVTKGGTRDFHGSAYEYLRNAALNANTWGRNAATPANQPCSDPRFEKANHCRPEPFRYNQFGWNFSGPVVIPGTNFNSGRDKLFFLFGMEWVKFRREQTTLQHVPTLRMRQGDFSEILQGGPNFVPQLQRTGIVRDPRNCTGAPSTCTPFDNNVIPAGLRSPNGLALLRAYPEPIPGFFGPGGQNFFQARPAPVDQRKETISVDYLPNEKHQLRFRFQLFHFRSVDAFRGGTDRAPAIFDRPNQTATINWIWTLSPTLISETVIAGSRDQVFIAVDTRGDRFKRSNYGINYPYLFAEKEIVDKIPTVAGLDGYTDLDGGPYPAQSTGPIYQINNNWTNIRGNHTIKFGGYFERAGQNDFDQINVSGVPGGTNNQNGRFFFNNSTPGGTSVAIANAAIGRFDTYAELGTRSFTPYRGHMVEWFVQDSWKPTQKLRIEGGVRHSIIQPYYSLWRNMLVFDPQYYNPAIAVTQNPANGLITGGSLQSRYNGMVIPGDGFPDSAKGRVRIADTGEFNFLFRGEGKSYSDIHIWDTFQPRVGVAYSLTDKMVFRAGAGRFLTRLGVSDSVFLGGNPPLQPTASLSFGSVDNPGGSSTGTVAFPLPIMTQDRNFRMPEAWTWNATFEREVGFNTTVELGYVGRRGLFGQRERNINQLQPGERLLPANAGRNVDTLRPFKGFAFIRVTGNEANSLYNGLQLSVNRRYSKGLTFGGAYTLSKVSDNGSAQRDIIPNAFDAQPLWGAADYDRRHVLVVNFVYELPFFKDKSRLTGKLLGGWTISGVSQLQSGTPFNVATGDDFAGVGTGSGGQFWVVNGDPKLSGSKRSFTDSSNPTGTFFQTSQTGQTCAAPFSDATRCLFTTPTAGTFNTQRVRNLLYGPNVQSHNIGMTKDFYIAEKHRITFRAEAFNWLNHPNWNNPETNPRNANFGKVTGKGAFTTERQIQFALRYAF